MSDSLQAELETLKAENARLHQARQAAPQGQHRDREELEALVAERTRELENMNAQLRKEIAERELAEEKARQHQEKLAHVARLNMVGEMTSGLAHEINQPLAAIATYTQGALLRLRKGEEDPERIASILEQVIVQAQRAAKIVQHLRNFVTKGKPHREPTDIALVVRRAVSLVRSELMKHEIELDVSPNGPLPLVEADAIQVEQVILNLLRNAVEAMSEVPNKRRQLKIALEATADGGVVIAISDTGPGITESACGKISTPFFSTKPDGMGLGLAISRTIVEDHGGRLEHEANPDGGATFRFILPARGRRRDTVE
jgi:C4-dicarboxylate-specific signal transduction histidine kinase